MEAVTTGEGLPQPEAGVWLFLELWLEPGTACPWAQRPLLTPLHIFAEQLEAWARGSPSLSHTHTFTYLFVLACTNTYPHTDTCTHTLSDTLTHTYHKHAQLQPIGSTEGLGSPEGSPSP